MNDASPGRSEDSGLPVGELYVLNAIEGPTGRIGHGEGDNARLTGKDLVVDRVQGGGSRPASRVSRTVGPDREELKRRDSSKRGGSGRACHRGEGPPVG